MQPTAFGAPLPKKTYYLVIDSISPGGVHSGNASGARILLRCCLHVRNTRSTKIQNDRKSIVRHEVIESRSVHKGRIEFNSQKAVRQFVVIQKFHRCAVNPLTIGL